jgi:hypothetical protein
MPATASGGRSPAGPCRIRAASWRPEATSTSSRSQPASARLQSPTSTRPLRSRRTSACPIAIVRTPPSFDVRTRLSARRYAPPSARIPRLSATPQLFCSDRNAVLCCRLLEWSPGQVPAVAIARPEAATAHGGRASGNAGIPRHAGDEPPGVCLAPNAFTRRADLVAVFSCARSGAVGSVGQDCELSIFRPTGSGRRARHRRSARSRRDRYRPRASKNCCTRPAR